MAFKVTQWEYSNEIDQTQIPIEEGLAYLYITNARYDENEGIYSIDFENVQTNAQFNVRYYLIQRDEYGNKSLNPQTKGTLISLGKALAGVQIGIPKDCDIRGGVVSGYIYMKDSSNGRKYPKIYHFEPVNQDMAACATIDQYYIGAEEEPEVQSTE